MFLFEIYVINWLLQATCGQSQELKTETNKEANQATIIARQKNHMQNIEFFEKLFQQGVNSTLLPQDVNQALYRELIMTKSIRKG